MTLKYIKRACKLILLIISAFWAQTRFLINSAPSGNNKNVNKRVINACDASHKTSPLVYPQIPTSLQEIVRNSLGISRRDLSA